MTDKPPAEQPSPSTFEASPDSKQVFVDWLRLVAPYIHAFRGKTFVVAVDGELAVHGYLAALAQDLSLLHAMGMRIVLVCGSRPQVEEQLALRNIAPVFHKGWRVTDLAALECAKEAAGELRLDIEASFSQGLPNTPMAHSAMRVISGNFITARPIGIMDGVDLQHTGLVRKVDIKAMVEANGGSDRFLDDRLGVLLLVPLSHTKATVGVLMLLSITRAKLCAGLVLPAGSVAITLTLPLAITRVGVTLHLPSAATVVLSTSPVPGMVTWMMSPVVPVPLMVGVSSWVKRSVLAALLLVSSSCTVNTGALVSTA